MLDNIGIESSFHPCRILIFSDQAALIHKLHSYTKTMSMKKLSDLFIFLVLFITGLNTVRSQCEIDLGPDSLVCGFVYEILPNPQGGTFSLLNCNGMSNFVNISVEGGLFRLTFSECGLYELEYHFQDNNCDVRDTLYLRVENPDQLIHNASTNAAVNYVGLACHADVVSCTNTVSIPGLDPPVVEWDFCLDLFCNLFDFSTSVFMADSSMCTADSIGIELFLGSAEYSACSSVSQDSIIDIDSFGNIIQNDFFDYVGLITSVNLDSLNDCNQPDPYCFIDDQTPIDTLQDTISILIPVRLGGQWAFVDTDSLLLLEDTSMLLIGNDTFQMVIVPGADYYGPDEISISMFNLVNGQPVPLDMSLSIQLQWVEEWTYDTITSIRQIPVYDEGCVKGGFNQSTQIGDIPEFPCGPIEIHFEDPCACIQMDLTLSLSGNITCDEPCVELWANAWADEAYTIFWMDPFGQIISGENIFVCDPGPYNAIIETISGCIMEQFIFVDDLRQPVQITGSSTLEITCNEDCVSPFISVNSYSNNLAYNWSGGGFSSNELMPLFCEPGIFELHVLDLENGCEAVFNLEVIKNNPPIELSLQNTPVINCDETCPNPQYNISVNDPNLTYAWTGPNGFISSEQIPDLCYAGEYKLTVTNNSGCQGNLSFTIESFLNEPDFNIVGEKVLCDGLCTSLFFDSEIQEDWSISWLAPNGQIFKQSHIEICEPGIYQVIAMDSISKCETIEEVEIQSFNRNDFELLAISSCSNINDGEIQINLSNSKQIDAIAVNDITQEQLYIEHLPPGIHEVKLSVQHCEIKAEIEVEEIPAIELDLKDRYSLCEAEDQLIDISNQKGLNESTTIIWPDGTSDLSYAPEYEGQFVLQVVNRCETISHDFAVIGTKNYQEPAFFIPNLFTPNNDGINDFFTVQTNHTPSSYLLQIYSRWGDLVFESNALENAWNGNWKGRKEDPGVYIYQLKMDHLDCQGQKQWLNVQGDVTLVR